MKTRVQKWGNSLAARIPKSFAEDLGLRDGSPVEMTLEDGAVAIRPDREKAWDLEALLAEVTDENVHPAWESEGSGSRGEEGESRGGGR
jgi:antitoxin MazE